VALGNSYPAIQLDDRGEQVDSGVVLQFTDDTEQPGSGGVGSQGVNAAMRVGSTAATTDGANFIGSVVGSVTVTVMGWAEVGAMGQVETLQAVGYMLAGAVPETADALDIQLSVSVIDSLGVNSASCQGWFSVAQPVTDLASNNTLTGGTWSVLAGTDLVPTGDVLVSTAGGLFFISVTGHTSWD
jgi:hypothetical protein